MAFLRALAAADDDGARDERVKKRSIARQFFTPPLSFGVP
jgi:hypothetical protein